MLGPSLRSIVLYAIALRDLPAITRFTLYLTGKHVTNDIQVRTVLFLFQLERHRLEAIVIGYYQRDAYG